MLVDTSQHLYICGSNYQSQLGNNRELRVFVPERVFDKQIYSVSRGSNHNFVKDSDNIIYAFGDNSKGQLGLGHTRQIDEPTPLPLEFSQAFWCSKSKTKSARK